MRKSSCHQKVDVTVALSGLRWCPMALPSNDDCCQIATAPSLRIAVTDDCMDYAGREGQADFAAASGAGARVAAVGDAGPRSGRVRSASAIHAGLRVPSAYRVLGHKTLRRARWG